MKPDTDRKRARFRALHETGCFVLPNPWDVGSARMLQSLGFPALASTSSGYAWTTGRSDYGLGLDEVLAHLETLSAAVDIPLNADFEAGFATDAEGVGVNVARAIDTGVAGLSIEDRDETGARLYDTVVAVERVGAALAAITASRADVVLVARTEGLLLDPDAVSPAIDRLVAFAAAGADCLYAPGLRKPDDIAALVRAVAPRPVNVLIRDPSQRVADLADLGVRRVSVGGALARAAWGGALAAAEAMLAGSFEGLTGIPSAARVEELVTGTVDR